jgi:hypothetical protein
MVLPPVCAIRVCARAQFADRAAIRVHGLAHRRRHAGIVNVEHAIAIQIFVADVACPVTDLGGFKRSLLVRGVLKDVEERLASLREGFAGRGHSSHQASQK